VRLEVDDRPGVLAAPRRAFGAEGVSIARLTQSPSNGHAGLDIVTHAAPGGRVAAALAQIAALPEVVASPEPLRVISAREV